MSNIQNTLIAEDRLYSRWEREKKNRILNMVDPFKRQKEWIEMFGTKEEASDDYLLGEIF